MASRTRALLDTLKLNAKFQHYQADQVFTPFEEPAKAVDQFLSTVKEINTDNKLTNEGRIFHRQAAAAKAIDAIQKFHAAKTPGMLADIAAKNQSVVSHGPG